jgi:hypothetical protein
MTVRKYSSRSQQTTLSSPITSTATTMTVVNGSSIMGGKTLTGTQTYTVVIDPDTALEEIVDITVYSTGNALNITRGVDGPTPGTGSAHSAGAVVRHMAIGRDYQEANDHIEDTTVVHGITDTAALVTLTGSQTLTGKTLTSPTLTTPALGTPASGVLTNATGLPLTTGVTGTLPVLNGGTGVTTSTGSGNNVLSTSPTLVTPILGTPTSGTLTNTTGLPISTGVSGLGTGVATFLATPSSANLIAAVTNETGTGALVFGTSPTIGTPTLTTPTVTGLTLNDASIIFEGATADAFETTLTVTDPTADRTITLPNITGTVVTTGDTGTVTGTMIADNTIVNAEINSAAAIAYSKLNLNGTITSADIVNGTIVAGDIADGTITAAKLVSDPYARANHTGTQLAATVSDFDTQVRTSRLDQMAAPTASVALNAQKITGLADPTLAQDAATKAYTDTAVANLVNSAPGTLDTLGEIATAIQAGGSVFDAMVLKAGSTMTGALTLSGAPTVGLHAATKTYVDTVAGSATAAAASAADAATTYDNFDDRYLGAKSSAPTVDNDGNALIVGALYWNTPGATMYAWTGSVWGSISSTAAIYRYKFIAAGGETSVSGADANGLTLSYLAGYEQVYLNGVLLVRTTDYTASNGTSITSLAALAASDIVEIITFTAFDLATAVPNTAFTAKGTILVGTAAGTYAAQAVGSNGQVLTANSAQADGVEWTTISGYSAPTLGSTSIASGATVTTIAGLTLTAPTLTGTVTASGDINLTGTGAVGSINDEFILILMGAL